MDTSIDGYKFLVNLVHDPGASSCEFSKLSLLTNHSVLFVCLSPDDTESVIP